VSSLRPSDHPVLLSSLLFLPNSSGSSTKWTVGSSDGVNFIWLATQCTNYIDAYAPMIPSIYTTVCFLFFSLLDFDPRKIDYLLNLACGIFASLGPRSVYKDMLNNMVSPIDHVVMNHQHQTQTNGIWGHVRYNFPLLVIYDNTTKASINLQKLIKLEPLTLTWMLTIIQTPPRSNFPLFWYSLPMFTRSLPLPTLEPLGLLWSHILPLWNKISKTSKTKGVQGN
jgi:hypothetical protein